MAVECLGEPNRGLAARGTLGALVEKDEKAAVGHGVFRQWHAIVRALVAVRLDLAQARAGPPRRLKPLQEIDARQTRALARVPKSIRRGDQDPSSEPRAIRCLLDLAAELKRSKYAGNELPRLKGKNIALIFEKASTRTRCAFEVAVHDQGGHVTYIDPASSQSGHKESLKDTARVLGCCCCTQATVLSSTACSTKQRLSSGELSPPSRASNLAVGWCSDAMPS